MVLLTTGSSLLIALSIGRGGTFSPLAVIMISFMRPVMYRKSFGRDGKRNSLDFHNQTTELLHELHVATVCMYIASVVISHTMYMHILHTWKTTPTGSTHLVNEAEIT